MTDLIDIPINTQEIMLTAVFYFSGNLSEKGLYRF